ncbi:MAG TPA: HNH endonuclease signature motif containing protein [Hymenobacter sp.]|jgi:hypothetical protein
MYRYLHQLLEAQNWLRGEPGVVVNTRHGIPSKERRKFITQKGQRCAYCNTMENLTVDHKLARGLGGTNARGNLQVLCQPCNRQKGAEEAHLLTLLKTVAGRAELLRRWAVLQAEQTARSQVKQAQRLAQRQEALRLIEANRRAGQYLPLPPSAPETSGPVLP